MLGPFPTALISCGRKGGEKNIITLGWVGVINSPPQHVSIAVRSSRYSYPIISETKEFVVNVPTVDQVDLADGCGTLSGKLVDKFAHFGVTPLAGTLANAPMIGECPINMECRLKKTLDFGSHSVLFGEVVQVYVDRGLIDGSGKLDFRRCHLLGFCSGQYLKTEPLNLSMGFTMENRDN